MEEDGMIHQYQIYSGFRGLLLWNDKRSSDKSFHFRNSISFRFRNSGRFTKHTTIFVRFWSEGAPKTEFSTRELGGLCFGDFIFLARNIVRL